MSKCTMKMLNGKGCKHEATKKIKGQAVCASHYARLKKYGFA